MGDEHVRVHGVADLQDKLRFMPPPIVLVQGSSFSFVASVSNHADFEDKKAELDELFRAYAEIYMRPRR